MSNPFKVLAEAIYSGKIRNANLPTDNVDRRKLTVEEIKAYIVEAFEDAKNVEDEEAEEKAWHDAETENEINWIKALNLKEFFKKGK